MLEKQMWVKYAPEMETEWRQLMEEGYEVADFEEACAALAKRSETENCEAEADALYAKMAARPMRADYPYREPSAYEEICAALPAATPAKPLPDRKVLTDRIAGAWTGRIAGCLLGKPMECLRTDTINIILQGTDNLPMTRYVDSREFPADLPEKAKMDTFQPWQKCWVDTIGGAAPVDDDTNYTVFALKLIKTFGRNFRPNDVLEGWLTGIPMLATCTAERVAYRNAANGLYAPATAYKRNPYREWIGAQIRGDFFGYINPGNPRAAAEMGWRDACISHVKNGIYGEMLAAAMIAEAAVCDDPAAVVRAGLAEIPAESRLAEEIRTVLGWFEGGKTAEEAFAGIHQKYDEWLQHDWCHTNSNAMIVATSVLYGGGDFGKSICMAVQTGFDTDCNGATVGSIVGMMKGAAALPAYWSDAFHSELRTSIDGYQNVTIEQLTEATLEQLDP